MGAQRNQSKDLNVWNIVAFILVVLFLAFLVIPSNTFGPPPVGRPKITHNQIRALENILSQYYTDTLRYPSTSEGLKALVECPAGLSYLKWNGPYVANIKVKFVDVWGRDLNYQCPGFHNPDTYDLWSYGADGKKGGTGNNADIGNW